MGLHVLDNLLDVWFHALYLPMFFWVESHLRFNVVLLLIFTLFLRWFTIKQDISTDISILLILIVTLFKEVRPIAELVESWGTVIILKVIVDIDEGEVRHTWPIKNLRVDKAPRL